MWRAMRSPAGGGLQLAAGGVLGAAAGCSAGSTGATGDSGAGIRVGVFPQNHAASPLFWSRFAPVGVRVRVRSVSSGSDMNVALQRGDLDFAVFGLVNGFVQHQERIESKVICMAAQRGAALVVARDSPHGAMEDLAGRRIGFKGPAFQYLLLLELLEAAGMDPERDVSLVARGGAGPARYHQLRPSRIREITRTSVLVTGPRSDSGRYGHHRRSRRCCLRLLQKPARRTS